MFWSYYLALISILDKSEYVCIHTWPVVKTGNSLSGGGYFHNIHNFMCHFQHLCSKWRGNDKSSMLLSSSSCSSVNQTIFLIKIPLFRRCLSLRPVSGTAFRHLGDILTLGLLQLLQLRVGKRLRIWGSSINVLTRLQFVNKQLQLSEDYLIQQTRVLLANNLSC